MGKPHPLVAPYFTDMMVDIETGGTDPERNPIIQIAAVKFNYATGEIGPMFNRCLGPAIDRLWDEGTKQWWAKMPDTYEAICARVEDPAVVMADYAAFAETGPRFWAKPTSFDFPFVASYLRQFGHPNPCHYRHARDLNTFIAALKGGADHVWMRDVPFVGTVHDGLDDCCHQISSLFEAKEGRFS